MAPAHQNPDSKPEGAPYRTTRTTTGRDQGRYHTAAVSYFERRARTLEPVATTETATGQTLDWVPIESQADGEIAEAPPSPVVAAVPPQGRRLARPARFELDDGDARRGPDGTVPVLRKDLATISVDGPLSQYLSRHPGWVEGQGLAAAVAGGGTHHYAITGHRAFNFGADGAISINAPFTETSADFSLLQVGIINDEEGALQSVEAGIQVTQGLYGDWGPHLFVYFTTNGYAAAGDHQGGYNRDVSGWVQVDGAVFPGAAFSVASTPGGDQYDLFLKYQLYEGNWWLQVGDTWAGYYPGWMYEGGRSPTSSLADHSNWVGFMGEVFDSDAVGGPTSTDMGSGQWADTQWPWAAYQRNLRFQADPSGSMVDFYPDGLNVSSPSMYGLETHMLSGEEWESYQYIGGPGAG